MAAPAPPRSAKRTWTHTAPTPRTDTRSRVQKVALELFAEQGYEKTSLREIAERLGVTKAALYYHFKSKEDIVHSFTDDYFAELDALLDWAKNQPPRRGEPPRDPRPLRQHRAGQQRGLPLPRAEPGLGAVHGGGKERFARVRVRLDALVDVLVGAEAPLRDRVRATTAVHSVGATCIFFLQQVDDREKLRAIVLEMATDLIG